MERPMRKKVVRNKYLEGPEATINRLYNKYIRKGTITIAVDFDDTLKMEDPYELSPILGMLTAMKLGFNCKIILYTCRSSNSGTENLKEAVEYCKSKGLEFDAINESVDADYIGLNGKIYYDIFLDDKAGLHGSIEVLTGFINKVYNEWKQTQTKV